MSTLARLGTCKVHVGEQVNKLEAPETPRAILQWWHVHKGLSGLRYFGL